MSRRVPALLIAIVALGVAGCGEETGDRVRSEIDRVASDARIALEDDLDTARVQVDDAIERARGRGEAAADRARAEAETAL
jgi:F0F1-type ATP synthase membrane subunit b/b'